MSRYPKAAALAASLTILFCALFARGAQADPTALALLVHEASGEQQGCGTIDGPCCIKGDGAPASCLGTSLACVPLAGQDMRCRPCGAASQPVCEGGRCNPGHEAIRGASLPLPICVPTPPPPPLPLPAGASPLAAAAKDQSDSGNARVGGCTKSGGCLHAQEKCVNGVCVPCGVRGQACCEGGACVAYGAVTPSCVYDADLGTSACVLPVESS